MSDLLDLELPESIATADSLPSMPGVVIEILRLSKDEDAGIGEFAGRPKESRVGCGVGRGGRLHEAAPGHAQTAPGSTNRACPR